MSIAARRWSSEWLGMPQSQTASYCACRVCHVVGWSRSVVRPKMRPMACCPASRLVSVGAKKTPRYPCGLASGAPMAPITSGAQPCMAAAPRGAEDAGTTRPRQVRADERDLLCDEAAKRKAAQIHPLEPNRLDEGERIVGHRLDGVRGGAGRGAEAHH